MANRTWRPLLITAIFLTLGVATAVGAVGFGSSSSSDASAATTSAGAPESSLAALTGTEPVAAQEPFGSYKYKPEPSEYSGPFFELSQNYPTAEPPKSQLPPFFHTNFRTEWRKYMMEVRKYCLAGNTEADWLGEKNPVRPWYNMPWQDAGLNGREALHGLTSEAAVKPYQLAPKQTYSEGGAYAVGYYNDFGGYTIGQVWKNHSEPNMQFVSEKGFPIGTVVCKPLFINIPDSVAKEQVPWLKDPMQWPAYTRVNFNKPARKVQKVDLVQMDFMVRDERTSAGWLFGTFQYNGALGHKDRWENLVPVGMMWGNDPQNEKNIPQVDGQGQFPSPTPLSKTPINGELKETVINASSELPPTHLGWNGRLNGPVDNFLSSCMSCHMTSSNPERSLSPMFLPPQERPKPGTPAWNKWWMGWFQNIGWKNHKLEKFQNAKYSLDFSLQLSAALENFFKNEDGIKPKHLVKR
jgi:hypothetical protein